MIELPMSVHLALGALTGLAIVTSFYIGVLIAKAWRQNRRYEFLIDELGVPPWPKRPEVHARFTKDW